MPTIPKSIVLDAKQIELIQKFIRLANNNPNDNEANVAARRVCKMLEGYLFPSNPITSMGTPPHTSKPDMWEEVFRATRRQQEEATRRAREQQETQRRYASNREPGRPPPGSDRTTRQGPTERQSSNPGENDPFKEYKHASNYWDFTYAGNEKRNLKCTKCGHIKSTRYRGPELAWICMECRGKEYKKGEP